MGSITNFLRNCATKKIKVACGPVKSDANEVMPTQPNNPIAIGSSPPAEKFQKSCAGNGIHSSKPDDTAKGFQVRSFSEPPPTTTKLIKVVGDWDSPKSDGTVKVLQVKSFSEPPMVANLVKVEGDWDSSKPDGTAKGLQVRSFSEPPPTTTKLIKVVGDWDSPKPAADMKKEPVSDCDELLTLPPFRVGTLKDSMWSDKNYKATLAAQAAEKLAKFATPQPSKPAVDMKKTTGTAANNEPPRGRARVPFNYSREQEVKHYRAKYDGSAQMAAWAAISNTIQKDDARAAAEADAWKAKMLAEDNVIEAAGVREIWNERHEGSTKKTGHKTVQVVGTNGEPIDANIFLEQYLSLSSVVGGGKPDLIACDVKGGVKGLNMWMSEVSAYLNGREFAANGVVVPSIWRVLPILFPNVKEMVVVLDTFTMGIPNREKLAYVAGHRIAKSEQQRMDEVTASFEKAGFKNVKLTFKVLVDGNGERDEMYLM